MFYTNVEFNKDRHDFVLQIRRASRAKNRMDIDDNFYVFVTFKSICNGSNY